MPDSPEPIEDDVRRQVERITSSATFDRSERLAHFLRFVADTALRGDAQSLKEWLIGSEVYGRGDEFDPRIDSIVRTEARRLRRKLKEYYESEGREDSVSVELPTGSYEPVFRLRVGETAASHTSEQPVEERNESVKASRGPALAASDIEPPQGKFKRPARMFSNLRQMGQQRWHDIALVSLAVAALLLIFALIKERNSAHADPVHRLAILPTGSNEGDTGQLINAFGNDLATKLEIETALAVVRPEVALHLAHQGRSLPEIASQLKADHVLLVLRETSGSSSYLTARMIRADNQAPVWTGRFNCSWTEIGADEAETLEDLFAYVFANSDISHPPPHNAPFHAGNAEESAAYARAAEAFGEFRLSRNKLYSEYAARQLTLALTLSPQFDDARLLLAQLRFEQLSGSTERERLAHEIVSLTEEVLKKEPERGDAIALLAEAHWELGDTDRAMQLVRQALQLSPLSSIVLSAAGRLYLGMGFFETALLENDHAFALDPTNARAFGLKVLCSYWMNRSDTGTAIDTMRAWQPATQTELFQADEQLRVGNITDAGHLIALGRELATPDDRAEFDVAEGLRLALMGKRDDARQVWEQHKQSLPGFSDQLILLAAQVGEADSAVHLIRRSSIYANYRYLATERLLSPLHPIPEFQALMRECYSKWIEDVRRYGSYLPARPPDLPSPDQVLSQHTKA